MHIYTNTPFICTYIIGRDRDRQNRHILKDSHARIQEEDRDVSDGTSPMDLELSASRL